MEWTEELDDETGIPGSEEQEEELFEHFRVVADKGQAPLRIDKFLFTRLEKTSRNRIQKAADAGSIQVNGVSVKSNYKVKPNDIVSIVFPRPPRENVLTAENIPLDIMYEDDDLIVLNKPAGLVVHPGHGNYSGTLVNGLVYHFSQLPRPQSRLSKEDNDMRPGLVHRLDKDTSGIMVIAKNETSMTLLARKFFDRDIDRKYVALVWGDVKNDESTVEGNIGRDPRDRMLMTVFPEGDDGKPAITHYKVLERFGFVTLVECKLETGRTHQIRVHMKYIGHTLFNDERYGGNRPLKGIDTAKYKQFIHNCFALIPGQALHARLLGFTHPSTGENMHFEKEVPEGFRLLLDKWRTYMASYLSKSELPEE